MSYAPEEQEAPEQQPAPEMAYAVPAPTPYVAAYVPMYAPVIVAAPVVAYPGYYLGPPAPVVAYYAPRFYAGGPYGGYAVRSYGAPGLYSQSRWRASARPYGTRGTYVAQAPQYGYARGNPAFRSGY